MNVLVDQTFPSGVERFFPIRHSAVRWTLGEADDVDLVRYAHERRFDALAMIGKQALARTEVLEATRASNITLLLVAEQNPVLAMTHLLAHLRQIEQKAAPGVVLEVYASRVESANLDSSDG